MVGVKQLRSKQFKQTRQYIARLSCLKSEVDPAYNPERWKISLWNVLPFGKYIAITTISTFDWEKAKQTNASHPCCIRPHEKHFKHIQK